MKVQKIDIDKLKPHPKNPRIHPDSTIEKLKKSIEEFGWTNPVLVSTNGYILAGHARLKAAKEARLTKVPAIVLPLEGENALAYMVADNRIQEDGFWDIRQLNENLSRLIEDDIEVLLAAGFEGYEVDRFLKENNEEKGFVPKENVRFADKFSEKYQEEVEVSKEKTEAKGDKNWFYIEYYGQDERFLKLIEKLKKEQALVEPNRICSEYFFDLLKREHGGKQN